MPQSPAHTSHQIAPGIAGESPHLPELDGVRGIAILCVLTSHGVDLLHILSKDTAWGRITLKLLVPLWGGVDLFFVLSGFLITGILLRSRGRPAYFRTFYARRALRIFPVYYAFLTYQLLIGRISPSFDVMLPPTILQRLSYYLYLQNWPVFWTSWAGMFGVLAIYWSLAVEEQFYMVWPTVIRFLKPRFLLALCIAGFVLGWLERYEMIRHLGLQFGLMQWPFSRLDGLLLGAALALYQHLYARRLPLSWAAALFATGAVLFACVAFLHPDELDGAGQHLWTTGVSSFVLMGTGLVAAAQHRPPALHRLLTLKPLVLAGTYSYGMYVYHLFCYSLVASWIPHLRDILPGGTNGPLSAIVTFAASVLLTTLAAALSFRLFERPILSLKRRFPFPSAPV